jgi:hypothetical protein
MWNFLSGLSSFPCQNITKYGEYMKRIFLVLSLMGTLLSACMVPPTNTMPAPAETEIPALPAATEPTVPTEMNPSGKLPATSFESRTYINETAGFALDYPAGWSVKEAVVGSRGSQVQFLSAPDLADLAVLPEGATRVTATIYQWDPKNDLAAFVANQKTAWDASGFTILEEEPLTLDLGLAATQFTIQTPDANVVFLITALGDQYLVLSGEGNLELVREIVGRLRPISK